MSLGYFNWRTSGHTPGEAPYNTCSPNLLALLRFMIATWACTNLGCFGVRSIRNGSSASIHSWGAAIDVRYAANTDEPGALRLRDTIVSWLILNHTDLGIMAIHDYAGGRIWRRGRGWKASTGSGMGESWATYFHIETDRDSWHDDTPIQDRGIALPAGAPPAGPVTNPPTGPTTPTTTETIMRDLPTLRRGDTGLHVKLAQALMNAHGANLVEDGHFGQMTEDVVRFIQGVEGIAVDGIGIIGTSETWPVLLGVSE